MTVIVEEYAGDGAILITEIAPDGTGAVFAEVLHDDDTTQVVQVIHNDTVVVFAKVFKDGIEVGRVGKINFTGAIDASLLPDGTMNIDVTAGGAGSGGILDDGVLVPARSKINYVGPRVRLEDDLLGSTTRVIVEAEAEGAVDAHEQAADPHPQYETSAEAAAKVATHAAAVDPHGDRAHADAADAAHLGATDPHGDRAAASAALAAHVGDADPHGDRAWATSQFLLSAALNQPGGVAGLDGSGLVALARLPQGANALLVLDAGGKVPTSALPPLAINETYVINSEAAMLALVAERGDMAIRTDNGKTYVLSSDSPTTLADWKELVAAGTVTSVAGKTGTVSLVIGDIDGLQTALDGKEAVGVAATLVGDHENATDPHEDRAYADSQDAAHVGATANVHGIVKCVPFGGIETAEVKTYGSPLPMVKAGVLTEVWLAAGTAPAGGPLTLQLKKNGANWGSPLALPATQTIVSVTGLNLSYVAGDVITISFTTVGSGTAAKDVTVEVCLKDN